MSLSRAARFLAAQKRPARLRRALPSRARHTTRRRSAVTASSLVGAVLAVDVLAGAGAASAATGDEFRRLAQCESGGNYSINTGNGYYGAYQFSLATWRGLGYGGYPHQAPPHVQDEAAVKLQARSGWGQWPACSRKLGLRSGRGLTDAPAPRPFNAIDAHYAAHGHVRAGLGAPLGGEFPVRGGAARNYQRGHMVWSPATGAHAVYGEIFTVYGQHGWEQGVLGFPVTDEQPLADGRQNVFQHGNIVWSPATGAQVLVGDIRRDYEARGGVRSTLGWPTSGERREQGGVSQAFAGGEMFWDAGTRRTSALAGEVLSAYRAAGGPAGELGMPLESSGPDARVEFEGGSITADPATRTASVVTR